MIRIQVDAKTGAKRLNLVRYRLLAGTAFGALWTTFAFADTAVDRSTPEQVIIQAQQPDDYKVDVPSLSKLPEPLVDTPQSVNVLSESVLKDQAVTNLNDALRTVPGVTLGAGEFSWQGNNPTIRGFVARNDMFLDGLRDFGSYYRDPFDLNAIEVLEGPSSVLFGRGSTGGVINQVSKIPVQDGFVAGTLVGGTDLTRRATVDLDSPVPALGDDAAFRLNAMVHAQDVAGRDVAKESRFGIAPSLALGLGTSTRIVFSYFDQTADDVPDYGIPWLGTAPAPVARQNFYGYTSDFLKTGTDIATLRIDRDVSPGIIVHNSTRYAYYTRKFRISEPIISAPAGMPLSSIAVNLNIWSGNSIETMAWDQAEADVRFATGPLTHTLIAGIEGGRESSAPEFDNSSGVPTIPLLDPNPKRTFVAAATYPRLLSNTVGWSAAPYALDTISWGPQWEFTAGRRWDYFDTHYRATRYSATTPGAITGFDDIPRTDEYLSYRGALVYKPAPNGSVYAEIGTSFDPSAEALSQITSGRSLGISNSDLAPEKNRGFEFGSKWDLFNDQISLTGAVFREQKLNAREPDPNNPGFNMLGGTWQVDGAEFTATGRLSADWQLIFGYTYLEGFGYTYLEGKVIKSEPGAAPVGSSLPDTAKNSLDLFTEYQVGGGFEIGGGAQYLSSRLAQNTPPLKEVPGYWSFDAMAKYDSGRNWSLQLNASNLLNAVYFDQIHPFHVVPAAGRTVLLTLNYRL